MDAVLKRGFVQIAGFSVAECGMEVMPLSEPVRQG